VEYLSGLDYCIIGIYFLILLGLGFYLKRKASASLEDYFLGGRKLPWWALGISGMASFLDITGTMIITSFLFMLGPRGLYIEFRGGAVLVLAVFLLWTGKWHRRSGCMTGAEWMRYRFGEDWGGQFARIARAIGIMAWIVGMLAYLVKGMGLFLSMFLPFSPLTCALIMIGVATVYTMVSGFYGVVFTDIFQSAIILAAVVSVSLMAALKVTDAESLASLATSVTNNSDWLSSVPQWHTTMPKGYEAYESLLMFALFYLFRHVFGGMAEGDDPKYFGARSDRECGKLSFLWTWLIMLRWPMMMGFAVLGLFLVNDLFPDQAVLLQAADLIKSHVGEIDPSRWADVIAGVMNNPQDYPAALTNGLQDLLGSDWSTKLNLVSFQGTVNPERILPAVLLFSIPKGLRGALLVALIAASMSTFDSNLNRATGFFTRDIYQCYLRPKASNRELIHASWGFGFVVVALGFLLGYSVKSINDIWGWIIMGLMGGMLGPLFLRFYWWRFNGGGFAIGTVAGLVGAALQRGLFPELDERLQFLIMGGIGFLGAVAGTYLTKPTDERVLESFYKTTRPFGIWGRLKRKMPPELRAEMTREHRNDILALPFAVGLQITLFLLPMQLVVHTFKTFWSTFIIFFVCLTGMYFFWYRNLPAEQREAGAGSKDQQLKS